MKTVKIALTLLLAGFASLVFAQKYSPDAQASSVKFKVSHQMIFKSTVTGTFTGLAGEIFFDPKDIAKCLFNVSVQAESINTGIGMRDNDLKKQKYFDAGEYKLITIKSQSIKKGQGSNAFIFSGTLTMKGITKTITFPFSAKPVTGGYWFSGSFELNRLEYNVGPDNSIDKTVQVDLSVLAK